MRVVDVSSLRAELSRFLEAVRAGETIEIRDRRTPIARIVPVEPTTEADGEGIPPWLEQLRREGRARIGPMKGVPEILAGIRAGTRPVGAVDALLEERRTGR